MALNRMFLKGELFLLFFMLASIKLNPVYPQEQRLPNVILITLDALRFDHLRCYGYQRDTSPFIDNLTKEGILFTQAISQGPTTLVSIASLLTSVYPIKHGIIDQIADCHKDFSYSTLTEILKENGYSTATFLFRHLLGTAWTRRGADYLQVFKDNKYDYLKINLAELSTKYVLSWLKTKPELPFFIWIHHADPHTPYSPKKKYAELFLDEVKRMSPVKIPIVKDFMHGGIPVPFIEKNIKDLNYYIALYDAEIRSADEQIGILMNYLKENGMYDNSIIIISSDHGEAFGEHDLYLQHCYNLYDELLRVPLIIRFPQGKFGGKIISNQVRLVDIMPTVLEYLNLNIPTDIDGESLMSFVNGNGKYNGIFSFSKRCALNALRTDEWKLTYCEESHDCELFNLKRDPKELVNLYNEEKEIVAKLKKEMDSLLKDYSYNETNSENIDNNTKKEMRSLGYIQ